MFGRIVDVGAGYCDDGVDLRARMGAAADENAGCDEDERWKGDLE